MSSWAIITGASSGIGKEYAKIMAGRGLNCVLVARRKDKLETLKSDLEKDYGIKVIIMAYDLSHKENCYKIYEECKSQKLQIDYLINNAGAGIFDYFHLSDIKIQEEMITLNMTSPTLLTHLFLQDMVKRNHGYIQFVASIASYLPTPLYATYGASKAYLKHLGISLNYELKDTKIHVSVINPGVTETEFFTSAGQKNSWLQRAQMMSAKKCAEHGYRALMKNKNSSMAGFVNWFTAHILTKHLPSRFQAKIIYDDLVSSNEVGPRHRLK
jgi:short-subunit dehydrogenase